MKTYTSHRRLDETRLMVLSQGGVEFSRIEALASHLRPQDLLVMNSSATIPASFQLTPAFELRLAAFAGRAPAEGLREWWAVSFGSGDWRQATERRGAAPHFEKAGEWIAPRIRLLEISARHPRLLRVRLEGEDYLSRIYREGKPVQYAYHRDELKLWDVQTLLGGVPLSVEPPSSLLPLSWKRLRELPARKAFLLHGAGLSSTGDPALDALLPLPEYFQVPERTMEAVVATRAAGGRIIAVGTTVARALESAHRQRRLSGHTDLHLGPENPVRVIDGLLTGYHEPDTSHFQLEQALIPRLQLENSFRAAQAQGFTGHEFGDAVLIA